MPTITAVSRHREWDGAVKGNHRVCMWIGV